TLYFEESGLWMSDGTEAGTAEVPVNGLEVTRKVYVSDTRGFARFLEIVHNPTDDIQEFTVFLETDMGSDSGTELVATSSGDQLFTTEDNWIVTDDGEDGHRDPPAIHVIANEGGRIRPTKVFTNAPGSDDIEFSYDLTLMPGETQIVMHVASQNINRTAALKKVQALSAGFGLGVGLTETERNQIVNFGDVAGWGDYYSVDVMAGDIVTLQTSTPNSGPPNDAVALDPKIELYDSNGILVASDDNSAFDGRNAQLSHVAVVDGSFLVRVIGANDTSGTYVIEAAVNPNSAPTIDSLEISATSTNPGSMDQAVTLSGTFSDVNLLDTHRVEVDWGDGTLSNSELSLADFTSFDGDGGGSGSFTATHPYAEGGSFEVQVRVLDSQDGLVMESIQAVVTGIRLTDGGQLQVVGTNRRDKIKVLKAGDKIKASLSFPRARLSHLYEEISSILVIACGDHDHVHISRYIDLPARIDAGEGRDRVDSGGGNDWIDGGPGKDRIKAYGGDDTIVDLAGDNRISAGAGKDHITTGDGEDWIDGEAGDDLIRAGGGGDTLRGGDGNDIVLGGAGPDSIKGDAGRDILIGGLGPDRIRKGADDDILIGGATVHDSNDNALFGILAEWTSTGNSFATRVSNLRNGGGLNGTTVLDVHTVQADGEEDDLFGKKGENWFWAEAIDRVFGGENDLLDLDDT
ncbi:MAG: hypothetical protein MK165_21590, partial [Pirellulaceae bacterium]|nr:hypothetical protein [Pirellulaceae bacterium]